MSKPNHENHHHNKTTDRGQKGLHKDWRIWAMVLLMLGAMAIYVLSFDERFRLGGSNPAGPAPAATNSGN